MNAPATLLRKRIALCILIPATVLFLASLVPAGMTILFSPMAFDAGPKPGLPAFIITLFAYPVVVLLTIIATWISFAGHAYRLAMWLNLLPIIHLIVLVVETSITG
ncbi:MAG: hypothetical protein DMF06_02015 [Verrucomicrobia bacterium]|nr:MAG: hypothetical protein DMF06_02015 [Verrucomicrobiota bacterium]